MVVLSSVSHWFIAHQKVLDTIRLNLKKGDFLYVVGGSGAGKSTLLHLIGGQLQPCLGSVELFGLNIAQCSNTTLTAIRRCIGFVPQSIQLIKELSVFDNVAISLSLARNHFFNSEVRDRIHQLLGKLGLANKSKLCAGVLSGGEAQRVAIARALIRSPELILADEPTGAQDREFTWAVMELFLKANQGGATIILATHDREIVRRVRKKAAILRAGQITFEDPLCIY